jgi:hypothetical protein
VNFVKPGLLRQRFFFLALVVLFAMAGTIHMYYFGAEDVGSKGFCRFLSFFGLAY